MQLNSWSLVLLKLHNLDLSLVESARSKKGEICIFSGAVFLCYESRCWEEICTCDVGLEWILNTQIWRTRQAGCSHTHTDSEIVCVCEESLKANAETGDIAVGGGQTNFEHSLQWSYYPSSLEVTAEAAGKAPRTGGKKKNSYMLNSQSAMSAITWSPRPQRKSPDG